MPSCTARFKTVARRCAASLSRIAVRLLVHSFPARYWYPTIYLTARIQTIILHPLALLDIYRYRRDVSSWTLRRKLVFDRLISNWLEQIAAFRRPFPLPTRKLGMAAVRKLADKGTGIVFCSIHHSLAEVALRMIAEACPGKLTVISRMPSSRNGYSVWGMNRTIPALYPDGSVLLKVRSLLRRGESVALLLDKGIGTPLQSNILHLTCAVEAPVIFSIPELQPSRDIVFDFSTIHFFRNEDSIQTTLASWWAQRDRVLYPTTNNGGAEAHDRNTAPKPAATSRPLHS